jgi:hypothetical protein
MTIYKVDKESRRINEIEKTSLVGEGFMERTDLQEWIANNPECLCPQDHDGNSSQRLLVIQKEYDKFDKTDERLDLMALDDKGSLVIIENKRETGKHVVWQAIKYAAYCSTMMKTDIVSAFRNYLRKNGDNEPDNAEQRIVNHMGASSFNDLILNDSGNVKIILVADKFEDEVIATAYWLFTRGIQIECIKVTLYKLDGDIVVDFDRFLPPIETESFQIHSLEQQKEQSSIRDENNSIYAQYWQYMLPQYDKIDDITFKKRRASTYPSIGTRVGLQNIGDIEYMFKASPAAVLLSIQDEDKDYNKRFFDELFKNKDTIDANFGNELNWQRKDDQKSSQILFVNADLNANDKNNWENMCKFHCEYMKKLVDSIGPELKKIKLK